MTDIEDRLRVLGRELEARITTSGVEGEVERRVKRRQGVGMLRKPAVIATAAVIAVAGLVPLTQSLLKDGSQRTRQTPGGGSSLTPSPSVSAAPVTPTPALTGTFAFEGSDSALYVMGANDSEAIKLVEGAGPTGLAWSPDGSSIAFVRGISEGVSQVALTDPGGTDIKVLAELSGAAHPTWSPSGDTIAFTTSRGEMYTVGADGSDLQQITGLEDRCGERTPSWSPTGTFLVVYRECASQGESGIYTIDPSGAVLDKVVATGTDVLGISVSSDGRQIAFAKRLTGIFTVSVDGTQLEQLTTDRFDMFPVWSPDGSIAFVHDGQIWTMAGGGEIAVQVTDLKGTQVRTLAWTQAS